MKYLPIAKKNTNGTNIVAFIIFFMDVMVFSTGKCRCFVFCNFRTQYAVSFNISQLLSSRRFCDFTPHNYTPKFHSQSYINSVSQISESQSNLLKSFMSSDQTVSNQLRQFHQILPFFCRLSSLVMTYQHSWLDYSVARSIITKYKCHSTFCLQICLFIYLRKYSMFIIKNI